MNHENPTNSLRAAIARRLGRSFAVLVRTFSGLRRSRRRSPVEPAGSPAPHPAPVNLAGPAHAGTCPLRADQVVIAEPPPPVADPMPAAPLAADPATAAEPPSQSVVREPAPAPIAIAVKPAVEPATAAASLEPPPTVTVTVTRTPPVDATPPAIVAAAPEPCPAVLPDPKLERLRAQIAAIETRIIDLETRKADTERLLEEYAYCQYRALGDLIDEHLRLQHESLRLRAERSSATADREAADAAAAEHAAYRRSREQAAAPEVTLDDDERDALKALYRAAAMRCHPDRVAEADQPRAHELFLRTQEAYRRQDLEALRQIGRELDGGSLPASAGDGSTPRERLQALHESLEDKGVALMFAIEALLKNPQYQQARRRDQWDEHFAAVRERLEDECAVLRRRISRY